MRIQASSRGNHAVHTQWERAVHRVGVDELAPDDKEVYLKWQWELANSEAVRPSILGGLGFH